jgi:hypothetical protein
VDDDRFDMEDKKDQGENENMMTIENNSNKKETKKGLKKC